MPTRLWYPCFSCSFALINSTTAFNEGSNGEARKRHSSNDLSLASFFLFFALLFFFLAFAPFFPSPIGPMPVSPSSSSSWFCPHETAASSSSSSYLRVVFVCVKQQRQLVIFFVLYCPCNRYPVPLQHVCCCCSARSLSFPFRSSCIIFFRTPVVCFASFFSSLLSSLLFCFGHLFFMVWLVLLCSCTRYASTSHLLYLDELRLLGLLCFTVCDTTTHSICMSDEESARTLGVLMALGRNNCLIM